MYTSGMVEKTINIFDEALIVAYNAVSQFPDAEIEVKHQGRLTAGLQAAISDPELREAVTTQLMRYSYAQVADLLSE